MFARLYNRLLLAVLPSVETHLTSFARTVEKLDNFTSRVERAIENEAVKLANDAQKRREAIVAVNAAYDRRNTASVNFISAIRGPLEKASEARDAVADFLDRLVD